MPERPKGVSDHPYYHLDELSLRERENFEDRKLAAYEFFFYLVREDRAKRSRFDKLTASVAVELTPSNTRYAFRIFKSVKVEIAAKRIARDYESGKEKSVMFHARHLTSYHNLTLRDVWIAGLWLVDKEFHQPESALPLDPAERARLDQLVSVVEEAMSQEEASPTEKPTDFPDFSP
jgi:hypothetical protein